MPQHYSAENIRRKISAESDLKQEVKMEVDDEKNEEEAKIIKTLKGQRLKDELIKTVKNKPHISKRGMNEELRDRGVEGPQVDKRKDLLEVLEKGVN